MTTRTRTPAEVEAGAKEFVWTSRLFKVEDQDALWQQMSESDRRTHLETVERVLAAADAAAASDVDPDTTITFAAPVVGVTAAAPAVGVSELNEAIEKVRHAARVAGATGYDWAISAERSACQDLFALLTAQPEPGTRLKGSEE